MWRTDEPAAPAAASLRYQVMTTVPENWIPFAPVHVDGDNREIQLQRAALPRILEGDPNPPVKVQPRTMLMRQGLDDVPPQPYLVHEETVVVLAEVGGSSQRGGRFGGSASGASWPGSRALGRVGRMVVTTSGSVMSA